MALFGEEKKPMKKERLPVGNDNLNAFLGEGTSFEGNLTFEGTVRVDGKLEGEIFTKDTLVVGESATLRAAIHAGMIVIGGTVHGNITAEKKVELQTSARLYGNISTPLLSIAEGVVFEGSCTMGKEVEKGKGGSEAPPGARPQEKILSK